MHIGATMAGGVLDIPLLWNKLIGKKYVYFWSLIFLIAQHNSFPNHLFLPKHKNNWDMQRN